MPFTGWRMKTARERKRQTKREWKRTLFIQRVCRFFFLLPYLWHTLSTCWHAPMPMHIAHLLFSPRAFVNHKLLTTNALCLTLMNLLNWIIVFIYWKYCGLFLFCFINGRVGWFQCSREIKRIPNHEMLDVRVALRKVRRIKFHGYIVEFQHEGASVSAHSSHIFTFICAHHLGASTSRFG